MICHNPSNTSGTTGINFAVEVHSIHFGVNLAAAGATYSIGTSDFTGVRYPAMSLTGQPHDTTNCQMCHMPGTEAVFPIGKNMVKNPQSWLDPLTGHHSRLRRLPRDEIRYGPHGLSDRSLRSAKAATSVTPPAPPTMSIWSTPANRLVPLWGRGRGFGPALFGSADIVGHDRTR